MPAAAVIPAPIAYIKVAAVKKLVVGLLYSYRRPILGALSSAPLSLFLAFFATVQAAPFSGELGLGKPFPRAISP